MAQAQAQAFDLVLSDCDYCAATCDCAFHENMRAAEANNRDRTIEDIRDAHDAWLRHHRLDREARVRPTALGFVCALYESGKRVALARGTSWDSAVEHALEEVGAL
jgi:hypothetical protein